MSEKILIVDDSEEARELIKAILQPKGLAFVEAADGQEGLDKAKSEKPQLVIADFMMPEMDGFAFFKALRQDPQTRLLPVIILTARAKVEDTFEIMGADAFMVKPIKADLLLDTVDRLLGRGSPQSSIPPSSEKPAPRTAPSLPEAPPPPQPSPAPRPAPGARQGQKIRKVFIFGEDESVLTEMRDILTRHQCQPHVVTEEKDIVSAADRFEPDLIVLQIKDSQDAPLSPIISALSKLMRDKYAEMIIENEHVPILLFRVKEDLFGAASMSASIADTETALEMCYAAGANKYLGEYAAVSFWPKIEPVLKSIQAYE